MTQKGMTLSGVPCARSTTVIRVAATAASVGHRRAMRSATTASTFKTISISRVAAGMSSCEPRLESGRQRRARRSGRLARRGPRADAAAPQQPLQVQRVHDPIVVARSVAVPRASKRSSGSPRRVTTPTKLTSARRPKDGACARRARIDRRSTVRPMHCRRPLILASVVAGAALSLLAAGCGGGAARPGLRASPPPRPAATTTPQSGLLAFSQCMRSNGMPNFPDPAADFAGGNVKLLATNNAPRFDAANSACSHLLPRTVAATPGTDDQQCAIKLDDRLSFARCMRSHGVSRFPDPTVPGQLTVECPAQGIDVHSPAVLQAVPDVPAGVARRASATAVTRALNDRRAIGDAGFIDLLDRLRAVLDQAVPY